MCVARCLGGLGLRGFIGFRAYRILRVCRVYRASRVCWRGGGVRGSGEFVFALRVGIDKVSLQPLGLLGGATSILLALLFWRSNDRIFLDRVCIHQENAQLKLEGLLNLGAYLKRSKSLVVVWDQTLPSRAWCIFEIAAYLKSHNGAAGLIIKPSVLAPAQLLLVLLGGLGYLLEICCPAGGLLTVLRFVAAVPWHVGWLVVVNSYWRQMMTAEEQLKSFTWEATTCSCCDKGHCRNGDSSKCDKKILEACIAEWFGSMGTFEQVVRTEVLGAFLAQLGGLPFGPWWLLGQSCYMWWGGLDVAISRGAHPFIALSMVHVAALALWVFPAHNCVAAATLRWLLHQERRLACVPAFTCLGLMALGHHVWYRCLYLTLPDTLAVNLTFAATSFPISWGLFHVSRRSVRHRGM